MAADAGTTAFVTGAAGFIGLELIKLLVARGHQVCGLAQCPEAAQRVRRAGATPVMGDLLEPGRWQDEAAADWVFHLPPHRERGPCVTRMSAASMARARVVMDAHLLDAVAAGRDTADCVRRRTRAATARQALVPSQRTNPLAPVRGDATSHPPSIASTDTSSPACRSSPRCPGGFTATARGFGKASSNRSWLVAVCCRLGSRGGGCRPYTSTTVLAR